VRFSGKNAHRNAGCSEFICSVAAPVHSAFPRTENRFGDDLDVPVPRQGDPNDKNIKRESLPGRTIDGIYSEGTRVTFLITHDDGRAAEVGSVEETWVSPDLKIVVFDKHSDGTINEIRELDRSEPDSALFEIPRDYKVVTE
jgi:hypothetical protein